MADINPSEMFGDFTEQTYGQMLARAREAQGMTVEEAASRLRLSSKQVIGIENCEPEVFATAVYARGHIKRYANLLRLDEAQVTNAFDRTLSKADRKLQSFISKSSVVLPSTQQSQTKIAKHGKAKGLGQIIFAVLILLVCILAWLYISSDSSSESQNSVTEVSAPVTEPAVVEQTPVPEPPSEASKAPEPQEAAPAEPPTPTEGPTKSTPAVEDPVAAIIDNQQSSTKGTKQTTSNTEGLLSVKKTQNGFEVSVKTNRAKECTIIVEAVNGDCWFGIYQDDKLSGAAALKDGKDRTFTYTLPVKISMGNPTRARVQLNGQEVDLSRAQRLGITNFTVKAK